jgi:hypothetical protein
LSRERATVAADCGYGEAMKRSLSVCLSVLGANGRSLQNPAMARRKKLSVETTVVAEIVAMGGEASRNFLRTGNRGDGPEASRNFLSSHRKWRRS